MFDPIGFLRSRRGKDPHPSSVAHQPSADDNEKLDDAFVRRLRRVSLVSRRGTTSGVAGEHTSPRKSLAIEFSDYRSYSPGDDLRRVDWNAYLRHDHLFVKLADAQERVSLHVLMDASQSMGWGKPSKFGYARKVALGLAYAAVSHMDAANLIVLKGSSHERLAAQGGVTSTARLIHALNGVVPAGGCDLDAALNGFVTTANPHGVAVLISDLLDPSGAREGLERLSGAKLRPVVIHLLSPEELNPAMEGDLELQDSETGETLRVSVGLDTLKRYQRWLTEWLTDLERFCARRGISYVRASTDEPIERLLLDRLRRERVLR